MRESSSPGSAMALPAREGHVPGPREESPEVHPAGEEFFPAVAVLLMNRPAPGAGGLRALPSRTALRARRARPPPSAAVTGPDG